jgi:HAD superfamily hydrolase (TIGR01509 family)
MIRWVFLDVGNVLFNDDPVMAYLYEELQRAIVRSGRRIRFEDLLREREELIRRDGGGHWSSLARRYLDEAGVRRLMDACTERLRRDYLRHRPVIPGMPEALERLAARFRLGLVANQLKEVVEALETLGWDHLFEVRAISEVVGLEKPDPALFRWALERAGCVPEEAVMVGDRVDNDIRPARSLGMWTVWFHMPHDRKGEVPGRRRARLYRESQRRISVTCLPPRNPQEIPDADATSPMELVDAILDLDRRSRLGARPRGAKESDRASR